MTLGGLEPIKKRTLGEASLLFAASSAPLILSILVMLFKFLRRLLVLPLLGLMLAASLWAGARWYEAVRVHKGQVVNQETGEMDDAIDWFAFAMAILIGLGVLFFLRVLFTHGIARAYTDMLESPSADDDN